MTSRPRCPTVFRQRQDSNLRPFRDALYACWCETISGVEVLPSPFYPSLPHCPPPLPLIPRPSPMKTLLPSCRFPPQFSPPSPLPCLASSRGWGQRQAALLLCVHAAPRSARPRASLPCRPPGLQFWCLAPRHACMHACCRPCRRRCPSTNQPINHQSVTNQSLCAVQFGCRIVGKESCFPCRPPSPLSPLGVAHTASPFPTPKKVGVLRSDPPGSASGFNSFAQLPRTHHCDRQPNEIG